MCSLTCFLHLDRWWPSLHTGMSCCYSTALSLSIGDGHGEENPEVLGAGCYKGKWHQAASVPLGFLVQKIHHNKGIKIPQTKSLNQVPTQETVGFTWWSCGALSKGMKTNSPDARYRIRLWKGPSRCTFWCPFLLQVIPVSHSSEQVAAHPQLWSSYGAYNSPRDLCSLITCTPQQA